MFLVTRLTFAWCFHFVLRPFLICDVGLSLKLSKFCPSSGHVNSSRKAFHLPRSAVEPVEKVSSM